jgi:hypothetical protein
VPGPRHSHAAAVSSNTMYVYGGVRDCGQAIVGSMHALDLGSLVWRLITFDSSFPRPPPLFSHTLTAVGRDRLVLIGGCPEQDPGARFYCIDSSEPSLSMLGRPIAHGLRSEGLICTIDEFQMGYVSAVIHQIGLSRLDP